jgi:HNH endonuclease
VREFLTAENHRELFEAVSGKTKLQIREVLAERFPQADVPASLKKLPALEPLSKGRYRLQLTLSVEQKEKLELARDLLSHANSSGDLAIVVERALDELISRLEKRRFGGAQPQPPDYGAKSTARTDGRARAPGTRVGSKVRARQPTDHVVPGSKVRAHHETDPAVAVGDTPAAEWLICERRAGGVALAAPDAIDRKRERRRKHIAHEARRELLERAGVHCAFVASDGQRCNARAFLQFHHRRAWARGGSDTADNLELLCHAHNRLLAERDFGRSHIDAAIAARQHEEPE